MIGVLVNLLWAAAIFTPLERVWSARAGQKALRPHLLTDLAFLLGQGLLFLTTIRAIVGAVAELLPRLPAPALPGAAGVVLAVALGDLCAWIGHRAQHRYDWLWRFHAVHHTAEDVDWVAAHREHPVDGVYTQVLVNLPGILLGVSFRELAGVVAFRAVWAIFVHSNANVPLGPLKYLFGSPQLHRWHHAAKRDIGNYANLAPYWDWLFGTLHDPGGEPVSFGIAEPAPRSYLGLLVWPFRISR